MASKAAQAAAAADGDKLETRVVRRKLKELRLLDINARYMTAAQFGRLVANLRRDAVLTSTPLIYRDRVLSGNHRVQAAIEAGIEEADCLEIVTELSPERETAIALSHNAITGQDDLSILRAMYDSLGLDEKAYSGLTDDCFVIDEIDITSLSIGAPQYEEVSLLFLPEEKAVFLDAVKAIEKRQAVVLASDLADFGAFFDAVSKTKQKLNIHNTAIAMRAMTRLALQRLDQIEGEGEAAAERNEAER